jgi:hypothetical protein
MKTFLAVLILSIAAQAQVYAWFSAPPQAPTSGTCPTGTGGTPYYCDFMSYVITNSTVASITVVIPWLPYDAGGPWAAKS